MLNIINTGKFFLQHQLNKHYPVKVTKYANAKIKSEITVYRPVAENSGIKTSKKVILAFHGMTMLGAADPKYISVCKSLSGCGYTVIAPQIDSMQNLQIVPSEIATIVDLINAITQNNELCPEGRVSIFAASFSAGMSLFACADETIKNKISSICLIGTFADIETSITYLISNQQSDNYGRLIVLKNFLKYSIDVSGAVYKAFDTAISDNFFKKKKPELPDYLKTLSLKDYDITSRLLNNPYFRLYHWNRIKKNDNFQQIMDQFPPGNYLKNINASVLLIHGIHDNVIPPEESITLFTNLKCKKVKSKLILTPLMSHSEIKLNINVLPALIDLLSGLSFFFRAV